MKKSTSVRAAATGVEDKKTLTIQAVTSDEAETAVTLDCGPGNTVIVDSENPLFAAAMRAKAGDNYVIDGDNDARIDTVKADKASA